MISRRSFFGGLIAAGVAAALDPEKLLWESGKKLISIPKPKPRVIFPRDLEVGDMFTVAGVYDINPMTRKPVEFAFNGKIHRCLKSFVVTRDSNCSSPSFFPPLIEKGQYSNVFVDSSEVVQDFNVKVITGTNIKHPEYGAIQALNPNIRPQMFGGW